LVELVSELFPDDFLAQNIIPATCSHHERHHAWYRDLLAHDGRAVQLRFSSSAGFFVFGNMVLFSGNGRKVITPNFEATEAMATRHQMYNHQMDEMESLYQIGIREAEMRFDDIRSFLAGGEA
jgi:hypothetical protein